MSEAGPPAPPPEPYFQFLGFVLVRKADLLAATAFLLALVSTVYQLGGFLRGPQLRPFAPDRVLLFFDHYSDGTIVTRLAAQTSFTNSGVAGQGGTVRSAWAEIAGQDIAIHESWTAFATATRNGTAMAIDGPEVSPMRVAGDSTESRFVSYAPAIEPCDLGGTCGGRAGTVADTQFLEALTKQIGRTLTIRFGGETFERGAMPIAECRLVVTQALVTYLAANEWYIAPCFRPDTPGLPA